MIYTHGFVPDDFGKGITIPVPKDKLGNLSNVETTDLSLLARLSLRCLSTVF